MKLIYNPGHDQRYAHINPLDRWKYPDAIRLGMFMIIRDKPFAELPDECFNGTIDARLSANDIPVTKVGLH